MTKKYIHKVTRVGKRSLSVIIPADIIRELKIREKQKVVVKRRGQEIIITDWPVPRQAGKNKLQSKNRFSRRFFACLELCRKICLKSVERV